MTNKKYNQLILLVFLCFSSFFSSFTFAQENLAQQDFSAYHKSPFKSPKWDNDVVVGMEAFHAENYEKAQKYLYKAFNKGCKSPIVLFQLALLYEYQESYYSALEYYKMAEKHFKQSNSDHRYNKTFLENYGRALYMSGKKNEALPILQKVAKKTKSFWILKLMGMMSYEKGDTLTATAYFERAVRKKDVPRSELIYVYSLMAKLYLAKGEQDGALRYYTKVVELDPTNQEAKAYVDRIQKVYQQDKMLNQMKDMIE